MFEFCVFFGVLYGAIQHVSERGNKYCASDKLNDNYIDNEANKVFNRVWSETSSF